MKTPVCDFCGASYSPHDRECSDFGKDPPALYMNKPEESERFLTLDQLEELVKDDERKERSLTKLVKTQNVKTRIIFEKDIPPNTFCYVSALRVDVEKDGKWCNTPVADVGLFKALNLRTLCRDLFISQVKIEHTVNTCQGRVPGRIYDQLLYPVITDAFLPNTLGSGVSMDTCFPEKMTFIVSNKTNTPKFFNLEVHGISLPDCTQR